MRRITEGHFALGGLFAFALWIFIALPLLYSNQQNGSDHDHAANNCSAEESKNHGFWEKADCDPVAYFTLWLVWMTGVLAVSTIGLWGVTGWGIYRQRRDTEILQRAYLSVEPGGISASSDPQKCHPNIAIRNVGNLPAGQIKWFIDFLVTLDDRLSHLPVDRDRAEGKNTLAPGGTMTQGGRIIYLGDDPGDLRKQVGLYLYIWGAVFYDDGFGNDRATYFCHRYNTVNLENQMRKEYLGGTPVITEAGKMISADYARYHRYGNDAT